MPGVKGPFTREQYWQMIEHDSLAFSGKPYLYAIPDKIMLKDKIDYVCPDHGPVTNQTYSAHKKHKCRECGIQEISRQKTGKPTILRRSLAEVIHEVAGIHKGLDFSRVTSFESVKQYWELRCVPHDTWYKTRVFNLLYDGARGCPVCAKEVRIHIVGAERSRNMRWKLRDTIENLETLPSWEAYGRKGEVFSRYQMQRAKLEKQAWFDRSLSVADNLLANGYHQVYDCGNLVFVKYLSSDK